MASRTLAACVFAAAALPAGDAARAAADDPVERGAYLARIMVCADCHSPLGADGAPDLSRQLTGGTLGFEVPGLGVFFPPNLTPHPEAGLGAWSDAEIVTAIRTGERPDGRILAPIMPWRFYGGLSDADAAALVAYLRSLPPAPYRAPGPFGLGEPTPGPYLAVRTPE